jgi:hypothetical protein
MRRRITTGHRLLMINSANIVSVPPAKCARFHTADCGSGLRGLVRRAQCSIASIPLDCKGLERAHISFD